MSKFAGAVLDALIDRPIDEIIGALLVGLALSIALGGVYMVFRRKFADAMPPLVGILLLANALSASLAIGYLRYVDRLEADSLRPTNQGLAPQFQQAFAPPPDWELGLAHHLARLADEDHDGVSSPEEVARMAQRMAEKAAIPSAALDHPGSRPSDRRAAPGPVEGGGAAGLEGDRNEGEIPGP